MGKRSDFERVGKDFYRTFDPKAVAPLLPFLHHGTKFVEPCAGIGDLVKQLEGHGHKCVGAFDIQKDVETPDYIQMKDVFDLTCEDVEHASVIITNPPWSREILHPLLEFLPTLNKPAWLLFDADWIYTKQAKNYSGHITDIVPVGRVKWIEGSKMSGKDNCSWYRLGHYSEFMPSGMARFWK